MSGDVVIWAGPVSASNLADVQWQRETTVITLNQGPGGGIGSSAFASLGASLGPNPLQAILAQHGIDNPGRIAVCGFSAAHGLIEAILRSDDAGMVNAVCAFDAYFTGMGREVKPGYLRFIERAAKGECLAVVTTSANGGPGYPPGDESFAVLVAQAERDGVDLREIDPPASVPAPQESIGAGDFIWANYKLTVPHAGHVHQLAVPWMEATLVPYLAGRAPTFEGALAPGGRRIWKAVAVGLGILGAAFLAYTLTKGGGRLSNPPSGFTRSKARRIADRVGVDLGRYDLEQFRRGLSVEMEHRDITRGSMAMTSKIVLAHLRERPDYYTRLAAIE